MSLNSADIKRIAHLARIEVNDAEADAILPTLLTVRLQQAPQAMQKH